MKPLLSEPARERRFRTLLPYVRGRVLDVGCGPTTLPDRLARRIDSYTGVDGDPGLLAYCVQRYPHLPFHRRDLDEEPLGLGAGQFDTVILAAVVEHLRRPAYILGEIRPLLAPGGLLLVTTPSPLGDRIHQVGSRVGLFYPETVVRHVEIFGRRALTRLLRESGYELVRFRRFLLGLNQLAVARVA